jgi:hypothetical protein
LLPKGAKVISADPKVMSAINSKLRKKDSVQTGGCYFETKPEDQIIYGC